MKHVDYKTENVCCQKISFDLTDVNRITNLKFERGCPGNLSAISKILEGFDAQKAIDILNMQMEILKDMRALFRKNQELKTLLERLEQVKIQIVTIKGI